MAEPFQYGIVLLAAGGSRRMGRPKQLLPIHGKPLVRHVTEAALAARAMTVVVVLGAHGEQVSSALSDLPVHLVMNADWQEGLSASLRAGVTAALESSPTLQALLICLADQPNLTSEHLQAMIARYEKGGCTAVASLSGGVVVPPILFDRTWFRKLCTIQGDIGARALLRDQANAVATVETDSSADLDTPEDYERFSAQKS